MEHRYQSEPVDAEFEVIEPGQPLTLDREPAKRREPVIRSWKNAFLLLVLVACIAFGQVFGHYLRPIIDGLFQR